MSETALGIGAYLALMVGTYLLTFRKSADDPTTPTGGYLRLVRLGFYALMGLGAAIFIVTMLGRAMHGPDRSDCQWSVRGETC